jgi:hypothetical protein
MYFRAFCCHKCDRKCDSCNTDDHTRRSDLFLYRRQRCADFFFCQRKPLVKRSNNAIDHGNDIRFLYSQCDGRILYFCQLGSNSCNGKPYFSGSNHYCGRTNNLLFRQHGCPDIFCSVQ